MQDAHSAVVTWLCQHSVLCAVLPEVVAQMKTPPFALFLGERPCPQTRRVAGCVALYFTPFGRSTLLTLMCDTSPGRPVRPRSVEGVPVPRLQVKPISGSKFSRALTFTPPGFSRAGSSHNCSSSCIVIALVPSPRSAWPVVFLALLVFMRAECQPTRPRRSCMGETWFGSSNYCPATLARRREHQFSS